MNRNTAIKKNKKLVIVKLVMEKPCRRDQFASSEDGAIGLDEGGDGICLTSHQRGKRKKKNNHPRQQTN